MLQKQGFFSTLFLYRTQVNLNNSFLGATYVTSANGKEIPISKSFHVIFDLNA